MMQYVLRGGSNAMSTEFVGDGNEEKTLLWNNL